MSYAEVPPVLQELKKQSLSLKNTMRMNILFSSSPKIGEGDRKRWRSMTSRDDQRSPLDLLKDSKMMSQIFDSILVRIFHEADRVSVAAEAVARGIQIRASEAHAVGIVHT